LICFAGDCETSRITVLILRRLEASTSIRPSCPPPRIPIVLDPWSALSLGNEIYRNRNGGMGSIYGNGSTFA
jgi:hypothetical protein